MANSLISGSESYQLFKTRINCEIYLNDKDPNKGIKIEQESISRIDIWTSIFTFIPTFYLELIDNGRIFNTITLQENMPVYIKLYKPSVEGQNTAAPWVNTKCIIKNFQVTSYASGSETIYAYQIVGTLAARNAIIENITYPEASYLNLLNTKKTSIEAIKSIALNVGLGYSCDFDSMDAMNWLEINKSAKNAIEHINKYSYISDEDISLIYVDLNNILNIKSLKNATSSSPLCNFMISTLAQKMKKEGYDISNYAIFMNENYRSMQGQQADKSGTKQIIQYNPWSNSSSDTWKNIDSYENGKFYKRLSI